MTIPDHESAYRPLRCPETLVFEAGRAFLDLDMVFRRDAVLDLDEVLTFEGAGFFIPAFDLPTTFALEDRLGAEETLFFRRLLDFEARTGLGLGLGLTGERARVGLVL